MFRDPKTTFAGIGGGLLCSIGDYIASGQVVTLRGVGFTVLGALLGIFAGDSRPKP